MTIFGEKPMYRAPLAFAALLLPLAGCSDETTRTYTDGEGNEVEITQSGEGGNASYEFESKDGDKFSVDSGAGVEAKLPKGFSVYPGAEVVSATNLDQNGRKASIVTMKSDADPADVIAYYRKQAERAGQKIESETSSAQMRMLMGRSQDNGGFNLVVAPGDEGITINLTVSEPGAAG